VQEYANLLQSILCGRFALPSIGDVLLVSGEDNTSILGAISVSYLGFGEPADRVQMDAGHGAKGEKSTRMKINISNVLIYSSKRTFGAVFIKTIAECDTEKNARSSTLTDGPNLS